MRTAHRKTADQQGEVVIERSQRGVRVTLPRPSGSIRLELSFADASALGRRLHEAARAQSAESVAGDDRWLDPLIM